MRRLPTSIHELSVNIELQVSGRSIPDADGLLSLVTVEVRKLVLVYFLAAVNRVPAVRWDQCKIEDDGA